MITTMSLMVGAANLMVQEAERSDGPYTNVNMIYNN